MQLKDEINDIKFKDTNRRDVYNFVISKMRGYSHFTNSDEIERAVKAKFGWDNDIENSAWQAWNDSENRK